jgi:abortive infection bacteriophage resistance protein
VTGGEPAGLSPFYIKEKTMAQQKKFSTFSEQVEWLQGEKQLVITDTAYAEEKLKHIGYFPLIGGYKNLFRIPLTKKYKPGTSFEEIVSLYEFDAELRELFFKYLLQLERHLRSLMSYYFSEMYGESQNAYLNINNYNHNPRTHKTASRLIATLKRATSTNDYAYINYYRTTYGNIPLWVLINVLTFGNLSKMYQVFPQSLQSKICKNFGIINRRQMEQFLSVLTKFRNVCAHGERLFTYRTMDNISDLPIHKKMSIPMNGIQYQYGKNDLFAVVIAFRYLIPNKDFHAFKTKLSHLIDNVSNNLTHMDNDELLERMGFPTNWKQITRYRIS